MIRLIDVLLKSQDEIVLMIADCCIEGLMDDVIDLELNNLYLAFHLQRLSDYDHHPFSSYPPATTINIFNRLRLVTELRN